MGISLKNRLLSALITWSVLLPFLAVGFFLETTVRAEGPAASSQNCRETVAAAKDRFRTIGIPNQKEAEQSCQYSRRTETDKENTQGSTGFCMRAWADMRESIRAYLTTLESSCQRTNTKLSACLSQGNPSTAQYLECANNVTREGEAESIRAREILDAALERVNQNQARAKARLDEYEQDHYSPPTPTTPEAVQALALKARQAGAENPAAYLRNVPQLAFEQLQITNAGDMFREIAQREASNRSAASAELAKSGEKTSSVRENMSSITGGRETSTSRNGNIAPSGASVAEATNAVGGLSAAMNKGATPSGTSSASSPSNTAGYSPGLSASEKTSTVANSGLVKQSKGDILAREESSKSDSKANDDAAKKSGGDTTNDGTKFGKNSLYSSGSGLASGKPRELNTLYRANKSGSTNASASVDAGSSLRTNEGGKTAASTREPASVAKNGEVAKSSDAGDSFGAIGQLGPSQMVVDGPEALTAEMLMGSIGGAGEDNAGLTAEEREWLGLAPGDPVPDLKAARVMLSERSPRSTSSAGTDVQTSGIAGAESPGLFFRVKKTHLRSQKRGILMHLPKKL